MPSEQVELSQRKLRRVLYLLKLLQDAQDATEAVWLDEESRAEVSEIESELESQVDL